MKKLLITGATGFIGRALIDELLNYGFDLIACSRKEITHLPQQVQQINMGELLPSTDWSPAFAKVNTIIHTAARVHVMHDNANDPLTEFRKVNVLSTLNLARQAAKAGVSRFVFISTIKVNGETTSHNHPFTSDDDFVPTDPYALSKFEAELSLLNLAKKTKMEVVIIRPPLVYGPNVKGNFSSLTKWIQRKIPLPFGAIHNQRSLVALDNLIDFIICCINHPAAANEIFLISDNLDLSTTDLLKKVAKAFNKKPLLLPIPASFLALIARLTGNNKIADRLLSSLQIDSSKTRDLLNWKPVITIDKQLKKIADTYLDEKTI